MKPQDLRIGNNLIFLGKICTVKGIYQKKFPQAYIDIGDGIDHKIMHFKPIPLTEEWLLKLGFMKDFGKTTDSEQGYSIEHQEPSKHIYIRTAVSQNIRGFFTVFNHSECSKIEIQFIAKIKYVYELQNLYYCLTGEEITIKE